jgi:hypothetical protein
VSLCLGHDTSVDATVHRPSSDGFMVKYALVTVGTTEFDGLVKGVDSKAVLCGLQDAGFQRLLVQHGRGQYKIQNIHPSPLEGFQVECDLLVWCCRVSRGTGCEACVEAYAQAVGYHPDADCQVICSLMMHAAQQADTTCAFVMSATLGLNLHSLQIA